MAHGLEPLPLDAQLREGLQDLFRQLAHGGVVVLPEPDGGEIEPDEGGVIALAAFQEAVPHLPQDLLGPPELAQAGMDLPLQPTQLREVQRIVGEGFAQAALQEEAPGLPVFAAELERIEEAVAADRRELRIALGIDQVEALPEERDGLSRAVVDRRVDSPADQSLTGEMRLPELGVELMQDVEKLQRLAQTLLIATQRDLDLQKAGEKQRISRALRQKTLRPGESIFRALELVMEAIRIGKLGGRPCREVADRGTAILMRIEIARRHGRGKGEKAHPLQVPEALFPARQEERLGEGPPMEALVLRRQAEDPFRGGLRLGEEPVPLLPLLLPSRHRAQGRGNGPVDRLVVPRLVDRLRLQILAEQGLEPCALQESRLALRTTADEMSDGSSIHRRLQPACDEELDLRIGQVAHGYPSFKSNHFRTAPLSHNSRESALRGKGGAGPPSLLSCPF